jgi:hypothetical protein
MLNPTDHERRKAQAAAARKARYRQRLKTGGAVLMVPVRDVNALIDRLVSLGWLDLGASEDRRAINAAVGALLDDLKTT